MDEYDFGFDFPKEDELPVQEEVSPENKLGVLIAEEYMTEYADKDKEVFFVGEYVSYKDGVLALKSLKGNVIKCLTENLVLPKSPKFIGVRGVVTKQLEIKETRGVMFLEIRHPEIVKEYMDIYWKHMDTEVFASSY